MSSNRPKSRPFVYVWMSVKFWCNWVSVCIWIRIEWDCARNWVHNQWVHSNEFEFISINQCVHITSKLLRNWMRILMWNPEYIWNGCVTDLKTSPHIRNQYLSSLIEWYCLSFFFFFLNECEIKCVCECVWMCGSSSISLHQYQWISMWMWVECVQMWE